MEKTKDYPSWFQGGKLCERAFCEEFLFDRPLVCVGGAFYGTDGFVSDEALSADIYAILREHVSTNTAAKVDSILRALRLECRRDEIPVPEDDIDLANGTLEAYGGLFKPQRYICAGRLNVDYNKEVFTEKKLPIRFLRFLDEMLELDDIMTLQEFLGYCMIPSTRGQAAMFIIGNGGEGKSVIGTVLREIFGDLLISGSFQRVETDRFFRYNLRGKLLMLDDDMQLGALPATGLIKSLITSEIPVDIEAKGKQSVQAKLFCRFLCFGNGSPRALYDKSDGFSRRLLILSCKPLRKDRRTDPYLAGKLMAEKEQIFWWMYIGLQRLINSDFKFTLSDKAKANAEAAKSDGCNVIDFLADSGFVQFGESCRTSSAELYGAYTEWCIQNGLTPMKRESVTNYLKATEAKYDIAYSTRIEGRNGTNVRGFKGIKTKYVPFVN